MKYDHPDELLIQQYALDESNAAAEIVQHVNGCKRCADLVASYRLMFNALKDLPKAALELDLESVVLQKINNAGSRGDQETVIGVAGVLLVAVLAFFIFYSFQDYLNTLFESIRSQVLYLTVFAVSVVLIIQCVGVYKHYKRKIEALDFY